MVLMGFESERSVFQRGTVVAGIVAVHLSAVGLLLIDRVRAAPEAAPVSVSVTLRSQPPDETSAPAAYTELLAPRPWVPSLPDLALELPAEAPMSAITVDAREPEVVATAVASHESTAAGPQVVTDIEYLSVKPAAYPAVALRQRLEGTVFVRVEVDPQGQPAAVAIETSGGHESLDRAALQAVRSWLFRPYTLNGVARSVVAIVPVKFSLRVRTR